jgi:formimidoylglutamate deiminase
MDPQPLPQFWTPQGWRPPQADDPPLTGWVVPGMANIHSHAFQRAMSGLSERRGASADSFWTWRELMYALAQRFDPETLRDVAAQLYMEMLETGYTAVCEFHYLHHGPDGRPYADPAAMSLALIEAARETGIQLLLLPTLYQVGGFDGRPLTPRQRRFGHSVDAYLSLLQRLQGSRAPGLDVGIGLHSLRAVPPAALQEVLAARKHSRQPVHLHIAEQTAEVEDCLHHRAARPVAWLLEHAAVDQDWCLVHATHMDDDETRALAQSGACVALCPSTEANLGDGLFPLPEYLDAGGRIGIGSDSHASVSLVEELRWLEYGQRLLHRQRNVSARQPGASSGEALLAAALEGGSRASGGGFFTGTVTLDANAVELAARSSRDIVDGWLFGSSRALIREVQINGNRLVAEGRHRLREPIEQRYRRTLARLLSDI